MVSVEAKEWCNTSLAMALVLSLSHCSGGCPPTLLAVTWCRVWSQARPLCPLLAVTWCGVRRDLFRRLCCESDEEEELACVTSRNKSLCYKKKTNTPTQEQASSPPPHHTHTRMPCHARAGILTASSSILTKSDACSCKLTNAVVW